MNDETEIALLELEHRYGKEVRDRVEQMGFVIQKQWRWYAVAKEMPEPDSTVLVYTVDHRYHVWDAMPNRADNYCWEDDAGYCHDKWEAVLWMPVPEP